MEIDNSGASEFRECPLKWFESHEADGTGLELQPVGNEVRPLDLGSRLHELWEEYYQELKGTPIQPYPESPNPVLETEAQVMYTAYKAKYPVEEFEIVDVERSFRVALPRLCPLCYQRMVLDTWCDNCKQHVVPGDHVYTGKMDVVFREEGILNILDHKSEKRRSNSNRPQRWAARDQASLYLWAAAKIYNEPIGRFVVNVLKRPSEKMQEGPIFPDRQKLERTPEQIEIAVRDLVVIANQIEEYQLIFKNGLWPSNREMCDNGFYQCEFYLPHTYGWSEEIRREKYQPKTPYLKLAGVPIIQPNA
jgi:hypothetical protein